MTRMEQVRSDFPILLRQVKGKPLTYLDSAATTLKPKPVIDALSDFYLNESSNVHRGAHTLSNLATDRFEASRNTVAQFISAKPSEVIFTRGTTESMNLVANGIVPLLNNDSEILLTEMEHHSNIVPWQLVAERAGAKIRTIPVDEVGDLDLSSLDTLLTDKTKLVSLVHCSNSLGTVNPIKEIVSKAHKVGALVAVDGAQAVSAFSVDVKDLDCDFYAFSGHKLFGPNGVGVLYGKEEILNSFPPYQGGGSMIDKVSFDKTTFLDAPHRFEAGTPHIAGIIGLAEAINYVSDIGWDLLGEHEDSLVSEAQSALADIQGVRLYGLSKNKKNVVAFTFDGAHPSDVSSLLDQQGVAIRAGHHCCQPLMDKYGIPGTARASFSIYSNAEDVERLINAMKKVKEML